VVDLFVIISIAAGQNTTLLLAKPNEKFSDMPRHPEEIDAPSHCVKCNRDNGEDDSPLECDKVCSYLVILSLPYPNFSDKSATVRGI
jgi:hypothetical protein